MEEYLVKLEGFSKKYENEESGSAVMRNRAFNRVADCEQRILVMSERDIQAQRL